MSTLSSPLPESSNRELKLFSLEIGRGPIPAAALMMALVFVLRLVVDNSTASGLNLLYTVPIMLVALTYGGRAGAVTGILAAGLMATWAVLQHPDIDPVGFVTRALMFFLVPLAVGLARKGAVPAPTLQAPDPFQPPAPKAAPSKSLTRRELEVLGLLAAGHTNSEIADKLVLSVRTIESHRASMQRKLGRPSRPELVRYAMTRGLLSQDTTTSV
jgi:DNA-binding CsgD family transcriptional regulator